MCCVDRLRWQGESEPKFSVVFSSQFDPNWKWALPWSASGRHSRNAAAQSITLESRPYGSLSPLLGIISYLRQKVRDGGFFHHRVRRTEGFRHLTLFVSADLCLHVGA